MDAKRPGWYQRIDVGALTLRNCTRCVIGQIFGDGEEIGSFVRYNAGCDALGLSFGLVSQPEHGDVQCGFMLEHNHLPPAIRAAAWRRLQDAWIAEIARRRYPVVDDIPVVASERHRAITISDADVRGKEATGAPVVSTRA